VRRLLASPRRRRRLLGLSAVALVVVLAAVGVRYSDSVADPVNAPRSAGPGWEAPRQERTVQLGTSARREALTVAARFVETAVARKQVGKSWDLIVPSMKEGYTRTSWARGDIPVVPFQVDFAKWRLDYSFRDSLGLKVALFPKPGADDRATVFNIDLRAVGEGSDRRWLVESFTPDRVAAANEPGATSAVGLPNLGASAAAGGTSRLATTWLLVPLGILSLILIVPLALGINQWYRGMRAERDYRHERAR